MMNEVIMEYGKDKRICKRANGELYFPHIVMWYDHCTNLSMTDIKAAMIASNGDLSKFGKEIAGFMMEKLQENLKNEQESRERQARMRKERNQAHREKVVQEIIAIATANGLHNFSVTDIQIAAAERGFSVRSTQMYRSAINSSDRFNYKYERKHPVKVITYVTKKGKINTRELTYSGNAWETRYSIK